MVRVFALTEAEDCVAQTARFPNGDTIELGIEENALLLKGSLLLLRSWRERFLLNAALEVLGYCLAQSFQPLLRLVIGNSIFLLAFLLTNLLNCSPQPILCSVEEPHYKRMGIPVEATPSIGVHNIYGIMCRLFLSPLALRLEL